MIYENEPRTNDQLHVRSLSTSSRRLAVGCHFEQIFLPISTNTHTHIDIDYKRAVRSKDVKVL